MKRIMFNDHYGLTRAVLNGRKTMTRRVIPPKVVNYALNVYRQDYYGATLDWLDDKEALEGWLIVEKKSRYVRGEVVAVSQAYKDFMLFNHAVIENGKQTTAGTTKGWSNKLFVRADRMPYKILITSIHIERLQDITEEDCLKEGIEYSGHEKNWFYTNNKNCEFHASSPRKAFAALISRPDVGCKGLWEKNPWVVAYGFRVIERSKV